MDSKVARDSRRALIAATLRLTPEERLQAFLRHCRLMIALSSRWAGSFQRTAAEAVRTKGPGESALLMLDAVAVLRGQAVRYALVGAMAASA